MRRVAGGVERAPVVAAVGQEDAVVGAQGEAAAEEEEILPDEDGTLVAQVFKTANDQFMGKLSYLGTLLREVFQFAREHKAYWLVPFILILGLVVLLVVTSQASAPFIYTLF